MQIQQIKFLTWMGALVVGGVLGWEVFTFLDERGVLSQPVSNSEIKRVLEDEVVEPEPPKDQRVAVDEIVKVFFNLDWTGKEVVEEVVETKPDVPTKPPVVPVADLLEVRVVQVSSTPEDSVVFVAYTNNGLKALHPLLHGLKIGDRLSGNHKHIEVKDITIEGVLFAFDDGERDDELVPVGSFSVDRTRIVVAGPDGAIMPVQQKTIFSAGEDFVPFNRPPLAEADGGPLRIVAWVPSG